MGGFAEMMLGCGFRTIDSMSPLCHIEVQFKDTFFREMLFEFPGNQCFFAFPKEGPLG
jgi:hypothetical protein